MTPEEIQAKADALFAAYDAGTISAAKLKEGLNDLKKGVEGYTAAMQQAQKQLGTSVLQLGQSLANGTQGASVFNGGVTAAGNMAAQAASQFGPLGLAIGAAIKVLTFFVTAVNEQSDKLYEANQKLAEQGLATAGGMTDVFNSMQKFSYGIGELGNMTKLLAENSQSLAMLGGTAAQGANQLADMSKSIKDSGMRDQYMKLGMSVDSINKGLASYTKVQVDAGRAQNMTTAELTRGAQEYLLQQDRLSKITGANADQLEKAQLEGQAIDAFKASLDTMDPKVASEKMEAFKLMYAKGYKDQAMAYANSVSGFAGMTKESAQQFMATGGQLSRIATDNSLNAQQIVQQYTEASKGTIQFQQGLAKVGDTGETMGRYGKNLQFAQENWTKATDAAIDQQNEQLTKQDSATAAQDKIRQTQMDTRDAFQSLINKGITPVTSAMSGLSSVINKVTRTVTGGPTTTEPTPTAKPTGPGGAQVGVPPVQLGPQGQPQAKPVPVKPVPVQPVPVKPVPVQPVPVKPEAGKPVIITPTPAQPPAPLNQNQAANIEMIKAAMQKQGLTDPKYIAATLGNVIKESGGISKTENLNYSKTDNSRIRSIFGSRAAGKTDAELNDIKSDQTKMGEFMYGKDTKIGQKMGNTEPGDGWKFRGRGFIQLTGKSNYSAASSAIFGDDRLVQNPDLANDPAVAAEISAWYMKKGQSGMAKQMGIDTANMSQQDANLLATSQIAGKDVRKAGDYLSGEVMNKVTAYADQMSVVANAPISSTAKPIVVEAKPKQDTQLAAATAKPKQDTQLAAATAKPKQDTQPAAATAKPKQDTQLAEQDTQLAAATAKPKEQPKNDWDRALDLFAKNTKTAMLDATDKTTSNFKTTLISQKDQIESIAQKNINSEAMPAEQAQQNPTVQLMAENNDLLREQLRAIRSQVDATNKLVQHAA